MKTYRVGVIGFAHMHVNELVDRFRATGRATIVAVADTVPLTPSLTRVDGSRSANLARTLALPDAPVLFSDLDRMLAEAGLDIAILCPEIAQHADLIERVATRGIHIVTEKPLAASNAEAARIAAAVQAAGVMLAVNWPITWRPALRRVKELIDEGAIGQVWELRWRNAASLGPLAPGSTHPGDTVVSGPLSEAEKANEWWHQAEAGGGALLDYCCYGACLSAWLLQSQPISAQCLRLNLHHPFGTADDNAALLLRFPAAMAVIEASWTTFHNGVANGPILQGTTGTIVVDGPDVLVFKDRTSKTPSRIEQGTPLPPGEATIGEAFLAHLETGAPLHPTLDLPINLQAVAILDAAIRSAESGQTEPV